MKIIYRIGLVTFLATCFLGGAACPSNQAKLLQNTNLGHGRTLDDLPITIAASCVGDFSKQKSWHLSVNATGKAVLVLETTPNGTIREFSVTKAQLEELRGLIQRNRFFDLQGQYGATIPDMASEHLTIAIGSWSNVVRLDHVSGWTADPKLLSESNMAIEIFDFIRDWFDDAYAADLRPENSPDDDTKSQSGRQ
jgi:hypothetical protein